MLYLSPPPLTQKFFLTCMLINWLVLAIEDSSFYTLETLLIYNKLSSSSDQKSAQICVGSKQVNTLPKRPTELPIAKALGRGLRAPGKIFK